jgi:hypothetical protein
LAKISKIWQKLDKCGNKLDKLAKIVAFDSMLLFIINIAHDFGFQEKHLICC